MEHFLFTSESVTEGHPDKLCDQISDAILDACIMQDKNSRVAIETIASKGLVLITGEVTTNATIDYESIARKVMADIGYTKKEYGIDAENCEVIVKVIKQSPDIAQGVDIGGAGDQGIMFGYANRDTEELMPLPIMLSHKLCKKAEQVRKNGELHYLRPDGKAQVTVEYEGKKPIRVDTVVVSVQHNEEIPHNIIEKDIIEKVIKKVIPADLLDDNTKYYINPTGLFIVGGPEGDSGLTGRKIIVDTYGGFARHGGGCFSGKDASKVDRSATYMARYIAKNIVASELADEIEIQIGYAIGKKEPVSIYVNTFGTGKLHDNEIIKIIDKTFDLTPNGIIEKLQLKTPFYKETASYGHFGYANRTWEKIDMVDTIKSLWL